MTLRNNLNAISDLGDLSRLSELVVDKRLGQRSSAKKNRRNRHYEKQFIRNSLAHHLQVGRGEQTLEGHIPQGLTDQEDNFSPDRS